MTVKPAIIKFTEPTIIAFSGAEFTGRCNNQEVLPNRIYLFDRGDVLKFVDTPRGNRIYLAVAGGIEVESTNILKSGDEVVMCRSEEHTSELQSRGHLVYRLLLEKKNQHKEPQTSGPT